MNAETLHLARRAFLSRMTTGFAGVALTRLLSDDLFSSKGEKWTPGETQFPPKAKQVLQIFCPGGASHLDTWDYKPELVRLDGQPNPTGEQTVSFQGKNGPLMKSPWPFKPAGSNGKMISTML